MGFLAIALKFLLSPSCLPIPTRWQKTTNIILVHYMKTIKRFDISSIFSTVIFILTRSLTTKTIKERSLLNLDFLYE